MHNDLLQGTSSTANTSFSFSLWVAASNCQSEVHVQLNAAAAVDEAERVVQETSIRSHHTYVSKRTEEAEEREWDSIVSKPHVRQALRRMAAEARRQYYAGETEEGGFGLE